MTTLPLSADTPERRKKRFQTRPIVGGKRVPRFATPRLLFAGGGTGGHLLPGIACAQQVRAERPKAVIHFAGTGRPLEEKLIPPAGFTLHTLPAAPPRLSPRGAARFLWRTAAGWWAARRLLRDLQPDVVIGLGGYGMVAPLLAARRAGIPVALLEQNAVPGLAVRAFARKARAVFCHFRETAALLPEGVARPVGSPLRAEILAPRGESPFPAGDGPALAVVGGSLGATPINTAMAAALPALEHALPGLRVLHLCGRTDELPTLRTAYAMHRITATVLPFCHDMGAVYRDADLVIGRAGGMTVAELAATGTPSVLVPLPHARQDHQRKNADALAREGGARVCEQERLFTDLAPSVIELLSAPGRRAAMSRAARAAGHPDAAAAVASALLEWVDTADRPWFTPVVAAPDTPESLPTRTAA